MKRRQFFGALVASVGAVAVPNVDSTSHLKRLTNKQLKARARAVLESLEYRQVLIRRINDDTLPEAVEAKLFDLAYGKPRVR